MRQNKWGTILNYIFSEHTIIAWMMSAAIIPMILLAFFSYKGAETALKITISNALFREISQKIDAIDANIAEKKLHLMLFSELPELIDIVNTSEKNGHLEVIDPIKMAEFSNYLNYVTPQIGVSDFYIVGLNGKVVYALHQGQLVGHMLPKTSDLYSALDGATVLSMPYLFSSFHGENVSGLTMYLSNVIRIRGSAKAILIMKLNPYDLERLVKMNYGYTKSEQTILGMSIGSKPTVVIKTVREKEKASDSHAYELEINHLLTKALSGEMAQHPIELLQWGSPIVAIYSYVPQLNMGMIIEYYKTDVYWKIRWLKLNMIVITLIDLLMVLMIVLWIAGSLREAHRKSERLLENILPKFVANELKNNKEFLARQVHHVSILFIDIINFTTYCASHPPKVVVVILDELFSIFDNICDTYKIEKIKTIGDAYMAASGLISPQEDHASRVINMGLDAIKAVHEYNLTHHTHFAIRVGIDSGNVIAGIIGKKKFSYDLWGNAVNAASRMESTGISNEVQISKHTYNALTDKKNYTFTLQQKVVVKGLGTMDTYLVSKRVDD